MKQRSETGNPISERCFFEIHRLFIELRQEKAYNNIVLVYTRTCLLKASGRMEEPSEEQA